MLEDLGLGAREVALTKVRFAKNAVFTQKTKENLRFALRTKLVALTPRACRASVLQGWQSPKEFSQGSSMNKVGSHEHSGGLVC